MATQNQSEDPERNDLRVLICGNYGHGRDAIDGQTIKTRTLRDALVAALGDNVVSVLDTSSVFRNPFAFYWAAKKSLARCTHVIILPGPRGVHVLLPLFLRWSKKYDKDLRYVVIGGFLPDFLVDSRRLLNLCKQLDGIYVETQSMHERMSAVGLRNVHVLPNFRSFDREMPRSHTPAGRPLKLVFCARVCKEKGIEEAIVAVDRLNADQDKPVVLLDVYGPVQASYKKRFASLLTGSASTTYKGVLQPEELYLFLQRYHLVLFPTYFYGEGFAGTIIDAFIAGVPVLASDWAYNREFVDHGRTGAICNTGSSDDLTEKLRHYVAAPWLLTEMRPHCIEQGQRYHVDQALKGLLLDIDRVRSDKYRVNRGPTALAKVVRSPLD